jgi:hypothetical protein
MHGFGARGGGGVELSRLRTVLLVRLASHDDILCSVALSAKYGGYLVFIAKHDF